MDTDDLDIRNSFRIAQLRGIEFEFKADESENEFHPNTVEITLRYEDGDTLFVRGSSIGGGEVEITNINGTEISFSGRYNAVIIRHKDAPGAVAQIARVFEKHKINIAYMHVYRDGPGDEAYSIIEIDGDRSDDFIAEIQSLGTILSAGYYRLAG